MRYPISALRQIVSKEWESMREIGGYIELEHNRGTMLHEERIALNCGRSGLAYLIEAKDIKRIALPYFDCDTVGNTCNNYGVSVRYYHIGRDFRPVDLQLADDEWLYVVNYYGQLTEEEILALKERYGRLIMDYAQAYFMVPLDGVDTIYSCRKFFGVADGAFLSTSAVIGRDLPRDESCEHMHFLLGRFEGTASEYYAEYVANNERFSHEPIKTMSALTQNALRGLDYEFVRTARERNWAALDEMLGQYNELTLQRPVGPFMYPLLIRNGEYVRKMLQGQKIYIPTLWPDVFDICVKEDIEYSLAKNILPLPIDQRYSQEDMEYMAGQIKKCI